MRTIFEPAPLASSNAAVIKLDVVTRTPHIASRDHATNEFSNFAATDINGFRITFSLKSYFDVNYRDDKITVDSMIIGPTCYVYILISQPPSKFPY